MLLYLVGATADEWPFYLIFVALPLPLIFPIYVRGPSTKAEKPRTLFIWTAASAVLGSAYFVVAFFRPRDKSALLSHLVMGIAWLGIGGEKVRLEPVFPPSIGELAIFAQPSIIGTKH